MAVNEQLPPPTFQPTASWKILGTVTVTSGTVVVALSTNANGTVLADAVRLVHGDQTNDVVPTPIVVHNTALPLDVNGDGHVSGLDALLVINALLSGNVTRPHCVIRFRHTLRRDPHYCLDVNGDGRVARSTP